MKIRTRDVTRSHRKITPHKGGRTVKISSDVTPETKAKLLKLKITQGISLGDLIEWAANNYAS